MSRASSRDANPSSGHERRATEPPRLILVDDNIRDQGGHYYELAHLLLTGAEQLGFRCILATHREFERTADRGASLGGSPCLWDAAFGPLVVGR